MENAATCRGVKGFLVGVKPLVSGSVHRGGRSSQRRESVSEDDLLMLTKLLGDEQRAGRWGCISPPRRGRYTASLWVAALGSKKCLGKFNHTLWET